MLPSAPYLASITGLRILRTFRQVENPDTASSRFNPTHAKDYTVLVARLSMGGRNSVYLADFWGLDSL